MRGFVPPLCVVLLALLAAACGADQGGVESAAPAQQTSAPGVETNVQRTDPDATPVAGPMTLRVMSYNVLWGGGFDRRFDANLLDWQKPLFSGRDRLQAIVELLAEQTPDVLAVQEAAAWDEGATPVAQQVAARLAMSYVFARNDYQINTALYSRYPILARLDLTPYMGSNSAQVAVVRTPDNRPLVVAVAHLDPFTSRMRACQVDLILAVLAPLAGQRALLLGDMNFRPNSGEYRRLLEAGWELLAIEPSLRIDQIWAPAGTVTAHEPLWAPDSDIGLREGQRLSDHYPVGALVTFAEADSPGAEPRLEPPSGRCVP
jgi:endonuclease/exonuclease/phosphatase family metal-dependent hydrolase